MFSERGEMATNMRSRVAWGLLALALAVEFVGGAILLIGIFPTFPAAGPERDALAPLWVSLVLSLALCILWVGLTLVGVLRSRGGWVRASAVTIHILVFAAAIGVFQGILGTPAVGAVLVLLGVVGFVSALLAKPVEPAEPGLPDEPAGASGQAGATGTAD